MAILERLCLTRPSSWMESHMDYLSVQARVHAARPLLLQTAADSCVPLAQALLWDKVKLNLWQQTRLLFSFQKRISD